MHSFIFDFMTIACNWSELIINRTRITEQMITERMLLQATSEFFVPIPYPKNLFSKKWQTNLPTEIIIHYKFLSCLNSEKCIERYFLRSTFT